MRIDRISIIGAGAWGTALAILADRAGRRTLLYARRGELAAQLAAAGENQDYLPGHKLSPSIAIGADLKLALDADAVLYAQPAQNFRAFCRSARQGWRKNAILVLCAKGIERDSGLLLHEIAETELPGVSVAILSGPSFASDAAKGLPTAIVIAGREENSVASLMQSLGHGAFRPYGSSDPVGVEVAGAVKNVLAIACGMVLGRGLGDNARAALVTRGLAEVTRLALVKGGLSETMMGLAGLGDLVLTCTSLKSRNMSLGYELGQGKGLADSLRSRKSVAEGIPTAAAIHTLAGRLGVEMPISAAVHRIVNEGSQLVDEVQALLARPFKHET